MCSESRLRAHSLGKLCKKCEHNCACGVCTSHAPTVHTAPDPHRKRLRSLLTSSEVCAHFASRSHHAHLTPGPPPPPRALLSVEFTHSHTLHTPHTASRSGMDRLAMTQGWGVTHSSFLLPHGVGLYCCVSWWVCWRVGPERWLLS